MCCEENNTKSVRHILSEGVTFSRVKIREDACEEASCKRVQNNEGGAMQWSRERACQTAETTNAKPVALGMSRDKKKT